MLHILPHVRSRKSMVAIATCDIAALRGKMSSLSIFSAFLACFSCFSLMLWRKVSDQNKHSYAEQTRIQTIWHYGLKSCPPFSFSSELPAFKSPHFESVSVTAQCCFVFTSICPEAFVTSPYFDKNGRGNTKYVFRKLLIPILLKFVRRVVPFSCAGVFSREEGGGGGRGRNVTYLLFFLSAFQ